MIFIIIYTMPLKTPFELEIVNDNDDNDNGDKVCAMLYYPRKN